MDPEALLRHAGFVRAIARGLLAPDEAEDVVQDTMLAALRQPPRGAVRAWLGAVGRRLSLKTLRSNRRRDSRERGAARPEALASAAEVAGQLEIQRRVVEAVVALDEPYRSTVVHRFFHERSVEEIAQALGVPRKTVESRLTRALAQLRARLDGDHGRRAWTVALLPLAWPRTGAAAAGGLLVAAKAKVVVAAVVLAMAAVGVVGVMALGRDEEAPPGRAEAPRGREPASALPAEEAAGADGGATVPSGSGLPLAADALPALPPALPGELMGRITGADGKPAAGARVWALGNLEKDGAVVHGPSESVVEKETQADELGIYRFEGLPTGSYQVRASHVGHAPSDWGGGHYVSATIGGRISLQLNVGGTLRVLIRDIDGVIVPDVEVDLLEGFVIHDGQEPIARAVSDGQGVAVLEHLAKGGTIRLRAQGEEHLRRMIHVRDGETTVVEVVVGSLVTGTVASEDGAPVRDARVLYFGPMNGNSSASQAEATIEVSGGYALRWLVPGDYGVRVQGTGIASWFRTVRVGPEPAVSIPLRLGRPCVLGRVRRDRPGQGPVYVKLISREPGRAFSQEVAADGRFAFYDVLPGEYVLAAREDDVEGTLPVVVKAGDRIDGRELVLMPRGGGEVELELLDAQGAYVDRVQFCVGDEFGASTSIAPPSIGAGRYRFPAASGRRRITMQWGMGESTTVDVDVEEGRTVFKSVRLR